MCYPKLFSCVLFVITIMTFLYLISLLSCYFYFKKQFEKYLSGYYIFKNPLKINALKTSW